MLWDIEKTLTYAGDAYFSVTRCGCTLLKWRTLQSFLVAASYMLQCSVRFLPLSCFELLCCQNVKCYIHVTIHTYIHPFNSPFSWTTRVSRYQKGKTNLDFTEARDSGWQWHQLDHMQVCASLQTDNHTSTQPLSFLQAGCPSCHPTNSVKALKAILLLLLELFTLDNTSSHTYIQPFFPGLRGKPVPER